jgi:hypothetical protein
MGTQVDPIVVEQTDTALSVIRASFIVIQIKSRKQWHGPLKPARHYNMGRGVKNRYRELLFAVKPKRGWSYIHMDLATEVVQ